MVTSSLQRCWLGLKRKTGQFNENKSGRECNFPERKASEKIFVPVFKIQENIFFRYKHIENHE